MGFIMGGMDFEYDFDNFPVDQALIDNIRRNQGRITPVDVATPSQLLHGGPAPEQRLRGVWAVSEFRHHPGRGNLGDG